MRIPRATEKERFMCILAQAKYELNDGVNLPYMRRTFSTKEYEYINSVCKYIERMIEYCDEKGLLVKDEYEVTKDGCTD